jgi:hypothetical protein
MKSHVSRRWITKKTGWWNLMAKRKTAKMMETLVTIVSIAMVV